MSTSDVKSREAFPLPTVDKANLRYQAAVRDLNNRAVAYRRKDDFSSAIQKYNDALVIDCKFAVFIQQPRRRPLTTTGPSPISTGR